MKYNALFVLTIAGTIALTACSPRAEEPAPSTYTPPTYSAPAPVETQRPVPVEAPRPAPVSDDVEACVAVMSFTRTAQEVGGADASELLARSVSSADFRHLTKGSMQRMAPDNPHIDALDTSSGGAYLAGMIDILERCE